MSRIAERLSSYTLTTWALVILIGCFILGVLLAGSEAFREGFFQMNSNLVRQWLVDPAAGTTLLKLWFVGLCIAVAVLGVNLIFCCWTKILRFLARRLTGPKLLMLVVHILFGLVVLGHFGGFMLGYRHDNVRLEEGESFKFEKGRELRLTEVHFEDDYQVLKKSRRQITRGQFHYRSNYAQVVISKGGNETLRDRVYVFGPLRFGNTQFTLKRFFPARSRDGGRNINKPGVVFVISRNPVLIPFLAAYPLMIIGVGIYLVMTWGIHKGE